MISESFSTVKIIKKVCLHSKHNETFLFFFDELYSFLTRFNTDYSNKVDIYTFEDFMGFSYIISRKLFFSFSDSQKDVGLYKFCKNMITLYTYNYDIDDKINQVFNFFDYQNNGSILVNDIITIFNHFNILYSGQKESLNPVFNKWIKYYKFDRKHFWIFLLQENSDILTLFYIFFNHYRKINQELINFIEEIILINEKNDEYNDLNWKLYPPTQELMNFLKENFTYILESENIYNNNEKENEDLKELNKFENELSNLKEKVIDNSLILKLNPKTSIKNIKHNFENINFSCIQPHIGLSDKKVDNPNFKSEKKKLKFQTTFKLDSNFDINENNNKDNIFKVFIYLKGKVKQYTMKLIKDYIIFFNSEYDFNTNTFIELIYINQSFIENKSKKILCNHVFYSLDLYINFGFSSYHSIFLFPCKNSRSKFKEQYRKLIQKKKIKDFYNLNKKRENQSLLKTCVNKQDNKKYFIKIFEKDFSKYEKISCYRYEKDKYNILKKIRHENFIKYYDIFETKDFLYLVYEYTNKGNLIYFIEENKNLSTSTIENIISQLIKGVKCIHSYGFVPKDLNPENIMIEKDNNEIKVKILNFHLIKITNPHEGNYKSIQFSFYNSSDLVFKLKNNIKIGVWNLGIISHYLSQSLDFVLEKTQTLTCERIIRNDFQSTPIKINNSNNLITEEKKKIHIINPFVNN